MKRITFDFETRSACDLKKAGAYKYSLDPTTRPTCMAWKDHDFKTVILKDHDFKTVILIPFEHIDLHWKKMNRQQKDHWEFYIRNDYEFSAHNAFFERCIYENILVKRYRWPLIPARQYRCTAAKAASCALPRSLQGAGEAMNLTVQKDRRGYVAMMATCKPTKEWNKWKENTDKGSWNPIEPKMFLEPEDAPHVFSTLYEYCKIDVLAEEALDDALPDLSSQEQEIWHLNQELNWRGIRVDLPLVKKIVDIMALEGKKKLKKLDRLTMGLVTKPGSRNDILEFLEMGGVKLPNLQAKTVQDKLQDFDLSKDARELLELRKALSLTSTRKYQSFLNRANEDERVRDIILYHGASTGRDSGTGVQPQNFPKGLIEVDPDRPYAAVENVKDCDAELLKLLYGESLSLVFSAILRNMIIPTEGFELFVGDYSMIEVAVLWWLAENGPGLKALREGKDAYLYQAAANTGRAYESFTKQSPERDLGKAQVLGCGFGMGAPKFQKTAWDMHRLKLSDSQALGAVQSYRKTNAAVPVLWKAYETAAITAVENPVHSFGASKCTFQVTSKFLWVTLPSGRKLAYREPQIAWRENEYGTHKTLEFKAVNSKTKKWGYERTWGGTLTENIVQATARDLLLPAMVRLEKAGYKALLTVHDEAVCERRIGEGSVEEFLKMMCDTPPWAAGCPVKAKGWSGPRYRK